MLPIDEVVNTPACLIHASRVWSWMQVPVVTTTIRQCASGKRVFFAGSLVLLLIFCGCTAQPRQVSPLQRATDPTLSAAARQHAIADLSDNQAFKLFALVTNARHPITVRGAAVDRMLDADRSRFWLTAMQRAALIDDWPMIRLLCKRAQDQHEEQALPWLTRSWAAHSVTIDDDQRPEHRAIRAITGDPAEQLLIRHVFEPGEDEPLLVRAAAWTVLMRVWGEDRLKSALAQVDAEDEDDPLLYALLRCARAHIRLPADREELDRLLSVIYRSGWPGDRWSGWGRARRDDPGGPLALRHLPAVMIVPAVRRQWDRAAWHDDISKRLEGRPHVARGTNAGDEIVTARPERLADHADQLSVGDYVVLDALTRALDDRRVVAAVFRQADADLTDQTTEHGGVLVIDEDDQINAQAFEPLLKQHDRVYFASDACVRAMHTGLAHYHFHAQQHGNAVWAGPGKGDLDFADRLHANCVVFTFVDANTLNVDAYFPGGVIVDLGCITR